MGFLSFPSFLKKHYVIVAMFLIALIIGPVRQLNFFSNMPGDLIDPRLNNFFLENIYLYFTGKASSLIHLSFFYPYPFVSGFSDNLFGAFPIYFAARFLTQSPEDAFQIWLLIGYVVNFIAAYWAIRIFKHSQAAAALGALLFTFGLPVVAQMGHAQLQYRFATPLAIAFSYLFLKHYCWRSFIAALTWLVWQFYCSIYLGFFVSLFILVMALTIRFDPTKQISTFSPVFHEITIFKKFYYALKNQEAKGKLLVALLIFFVLLAILFYPYLKVTSLYHYTRSWIEVSAMSPRLSSYLLADNSWIWGGLSRRIKDVPIRWEQQLFIGISPIIIYILGLYYHKKNKVESSYAPWLIFSLLVLFIVTLNVDGHSAWRLLVSLPLFSAIRALARIILMFLFPLSLFMAAAVDLVLKKNHKSANRILMLVYVLLVVEMSMTTATTSPKLDWIKIRQDQAVRLPDNLAENAIVFFSQNSSSFEMDEINAMQLSQASGLPTLNGYSGALPHHFRAKFGKDCSEYVRRIILYLDFMGLSLDEDAYRSLAKRVVPVGFDGCEAQWRSHPPMTISQRVLSKDDLSKLSIERAPIQEGVPAGYIKIRVLNQGPQQISAISREDMPVRLAWRFIKSDGSKGEPWDISTANLQELCPGAQRRQDLPGDIPSGGYVDVLAPIPDVGSCQLAGVEFTIVQEKTLWGFSFDGGEKSWAHDAGLDPLLLDVGL